MQIKAKLSKRQHRPIKIGMNIFIQTIFLEVLFVSNRYRNVREKNSLVVCIQVLSKAEIGPHTHEHFHPPLWLTQ